MATLSSQYGGGSERHAADESESYSYNQSSYAQSSLRQSNDFDSSHTSQFGPGGGRSQYDDYGASNSGVLTERPINQLGSPLQDEREYNKYPASATDLQPPKKRQARSGQSGASSKRGWAKKSLQEVERENSSNWVHREKLIALEIQDHQDRGTPVPQALIDAYRESTGKYHVNLENIQHELTENNLQRHTLTSPTPFEPEGDRQVDDEEYDDEGPFVPEDPRTPEEIAADAQEDYIAGKMYHSPTLRSSSSRIPVSKRSPHPVPQERIDRNTPLPRKRSASIGWESGEDGTMYAKTRSRSQSMGSQLVLDDGEGAPSVPSSPTKPRAKSSPRKSSTNSRTGGGSITQPRVVSGGTARPTTRDGRPRTAVNRPEEPAPWLADMYKPDPLLPPDQQIIPTHAKRLIQEQRQKNEADGQARDEEQARYEARLHSQAALSAALAGPPPTAAKPPGAEEMRDAPGPIGKVTSYENGRVRDQTLSLPRSDSGRGRGSYSTMPKVPTTPVIGSRVPSPQPDQLLQMQDVDEDQGAKSKGCGCCVVM